MTSPPPYGSVPGQPQGYPSGPTPQQGYPAGGTPPPAYGQQPAYAQQPPYPQPAYGHQPGYPAAGYAAAGYGAPRPAKRPGMVTAAAVLAFIWGGFAIIVGLLSVLASSVISVVNASCDSLNSADPSYPANCPMVSSVGTFLKVVSGGLIIVAILLIWGGVVAVSGKNGQVLVIGAALYLVLAIVSIIARSFGGSAVFGIVAPVLMIIFLLNPASKAWFKSKGAKTF